MHTRMAEMLHAFVKEDAKDVLKYVNVDLLCMLMYFVCSFQITNASECSNIGLMSEQEKFRVSVSGYINIID